jgi:transcriptional regulator with XRE-family HTH domain
MTTWNDRLAEICTARAITKTGLAKLCKVSVPTASDWLSGKIKNLEAGSLLKICDELMLDPWWLVLGTPKGKAPITDGKRPLSSEARKLVLWVERTDGLGDPALKILTHVAAALSVAESIRPAHYEGVVTELERQQELATSHGESKGAEKHAARKHK